MKNIFCLIFASLSFALNAINIDGKLDDQEWSNAEKVDQFYEVFPFSLEPFDKKTEALLYVNQEGIYVGFKNFQDMSLAKKVKTSRDMMTIDSESNVVVIDFNGNALEAYEFLTTLGGALIDGVFQNSNNVNRDWDGNWIASVFEDKNFWSSEIFIPWDVVNMSPVDGEYRKIRIMFGRFYAERSTWVSSDKTSYSRNKFLTKISQREIKNYQTSSIDYFPYISSSSNSIQNINESRIGIDIFWNAGDGSQINAAFNPDFGQAESDDLVVNFTAEETLFTEKRAFFTENQSLFDIADRDKFRIINTRRIGGKPSYICSSFINEDECETSKKTYSDLDYAFRYTKKTGTMDYGILTAKESDEKFSMGKDFLALRARNKINNTTIGYMYTEVEDNIFGTKAYVNAVDFDQYTNDKIRLSSIIFSSKKDNTSGLGFKSSVRYRPNKDTSFHTSLRYFDDELDINDFGYLQRSDYIQLSSRGSIDKNDYDKSSKLASREISAWISYSSDTNGNSNPLMLNPQIEYSYKDGSRLNIFTTLKSSGKDTTITRKNKEFPFIKLKHNMSITIDYEGYITRNLRYDYRFSFDKSPKQNWQNSKGYKKSFYKIGTNYYLDDSITVGGIIIYKKEKEWIRWLNDNNFTSSSLIRKEISFNLDWFIKDRHELRLKSQFIALDSNDPIGISSNETGYLQINDLNTSSFEIGRSALQIRYKYEIAPLSNLFIIYSRGGDTNIEDEQDGATNLVQDSWLNPSDEIISIKLRLKY